MANQVYRIMRNYRHLAPTKFHQFISRVRTALADKARIPDSVWGGNLALLIAFFAAADKHDYVFHESMHGSRIVIAEREMLQAQLVIYLEQIASLLEMVAVTNPDILLVSGFDTAKEGRTHPRNKAEIEAHNATAAQAENQDG
ncbi:hypothetical protein GMLC_16000 [Geomonas limicola]|uniref:Uncharacterized protein n=1 Tax=Geomonas limicola TaxID=2740186 RepID=A0A6V8N6C3_9BACT|nr:hypothetical protein [Geomonas limicola]GFO68021.1 hypothetical protein GMLC_16000 [Geomonas limicola]